MFDLFPLKRVRWDDVDGDQNYGVLFARVKSSFQAEGSGFFCSIQKQETISFDCILFEKTIRKNNNGNPICCGDSKCSVGGMSHEDLLQTYVREAIKGQLWLFQMRLNNDREAKVSVYSSNKITYVSEEPFEPTDYFQHESLTFRSLSLFVYGQQILDILEKEYENASLQDLKNDSRLLKAVSFLGNKGDPCLDLIFGLMKTPKDLKSSYLRILGFYL
jgi:hypothetical protein